MNIFTSFFGQGATTETKAPSTQATSTDTQAKPTEVSSNNTTPSEENKSPLDPFKTLFDNSKQESETPDPGAPIFNIDANKLSESIGKMDFTSVLDPELASKVAAGGEDAVKAMAANMNKLAQAMLAQSITVTSKMIDAANGKALERMQSYIPDSIRKTTLQESILEDNPAFKHPAVQPLVQSVADMFASKHKEASPNEIKQMTMKYLTAVSEMVNGGDTKEDYSSSVKPNKPTTKTKPKEMDWGAWMN